jgi:hypothetical protein
MYFISALFLFSIATFTDTSTLICRDGDSSIVRLVEISSNNYKLELTTKDISGVLQKKSIDLPYTVYHFEIADIDNNGVNDILVGVIKSTKFDPIVRKRLFAYKIDQGYIRPLWLGSRVGRPLEDFKALKQGDKTIIRTIEQGKDKNYYVGEYEWKGFGLSWIQYLGERITNEKASRIFNEGCNL